MPNAQHNSGAQTSLRAIIAMVLAMAFFVVNDTLVKLVRVEWGAGQILIVRGAFALSFLAIWIFASGYGRQMSLVFGKAVMLRGLLEAMIAVLFISAIGAMALADITAMLMLAPLMITAMSKFLFKEQVGWRRWLAVSVGFIGMLMVVQPGGSATSPWALGMAFLSVVFVAARDLLTRKLPANVPSVIAAFTSTLGTVSAGGLLILFGQSWQPLQPQLMIWLICAAFVVVLGNYAIIEAHRDVELSAVSPFRYSVIVFAVVMGIVVFGAWPSPIALGGIALICASGLYTLHRERVRRLERQTV